jgi:hypothetical protein
VSIPVALSDSITVGRTTLVMERSAVSREPSLSGQGPGGYPSGESENRAAEHAVREGHNAGVAKSPIRNSEQPPRVQVTGSAIPAWQWIVSIFIVGAILMLTYGAFQPWVRIQVRLAFEGMVGGELLTDALSLVNGVLQDVFKKPPLVTANAVEISGMSSYGWLTLLAACVAGLVAVLDLALRLKRSVLPGIVYVAVALLPGVVLAADLQRITTLGTVPILLGVNLLDIFQGATKILEPKVVPLTGLYLTVIGLALLTVAGILRAILPALSQGRKPTPLRA